MNVKGLSVYGLWALGFAALVAAVVVSLTSGADALSITNTAGTAGTLPTLTNTSTADSLDDSGSDRTQGTSTLALTASSLGPVADTVGNSVSFTSRYGLLLAADTTSGSGNSIAFTSTYTISFKVNVGAGKAWVLEIDTSRLGALTRQDQLDGNGAANIGAITGTLKADGGAKVDNFDFAAVDLPSGSAAADTAISQSSPTLSYGFTGSHTFDLSFTWLTTASSDRQGTAVRLGINGGLTSTTADDYPGGRIVGNDGHFVDIFAEIPFPATLSLFAAGTMLSAGVAWRKRRRGERASQLTPGGDSETSQS